jgi:UDP-N-acetyl-D-mannosaminuronic acid dehydrogenase
MVLSELRQKIEQRTARLVVIGLGYVGLPVAALFAEQGFDVVGVDLKADRVAVINEGRSPIEGEEPGLADLVERVMKQGNLRAVTDYEQLRDRDIILIDVETPVDEQHIPRYDALRGAINSLGPVLQEGALVIVESTIAPGTMKRVVLPLLEQASGRSLNEGFFLGNCPERVMPGKLLHNLVHLSRVMGGGSPETTEVMADLYRMIVQADLDPVDWITAELVKTVENAYRDVQIAFANEVALICEQVGGDVWKVRDLVNKSPYRNMHRPGAGVGGHCIPKDPWLLVRGVEDLSEIVHMVPTARAINDSMPAHVMELVESALDEKDVPLDRARVLILGYAYLENSDDARNSPSAALVHLLVQRGTQVVIHDPFVPGYQGELFGLANGCDAVVLMVGHTVYRNLDISRLKECLAHPILVDGRGLIDPQQADAGGFVFRAVGRSFTVSNA